MSARQRSHHLPRSVRGALFLALAASAAAGSAEAQILYVDNHGTVGGDGLTWSTAFRDLDRALDAARDDWTIEEIWVARGTYRPGRTVGSPKREDSFELPGGVVIYGGFPMNSHASEPGFDERDPLAHPTRLDGDIDGDGTLDGNVYSVVSTYSIDATVLDGFYISGGAADGSDSDVGAFAGGGLSIVYGALEVRNCVFHDNAATRGGALHVYGAAVHVVDCAFLDNEATGGEGGAVLAESAPVGSYTLYPELRLERCTFHGNESVTAGGAASVNDGSLCVRACVFAGNRAGWVGGALRAADSDLLCVYLTFHANEAGIQGGALHFGGVGSYDLRSSILWANTAPSDAQVSLTDAGASTSSCCVMGLATSGLTDADAFDLDPRFVDPLGPDGVAGTEDDDLDLRGDSPCINTGEELAWWLPSCTTGYDGLDVRGVARGALVDVGAYEAERLGIAGCFGDGSSGACPCDNESAAGSEQGCVNSGGVGAGLAADGTTRLSEEDLVLVASGVPPGRPALLFAGLASLADADTPWIGDGLRCVSGGIRRLGVLSADAAGVATYGPGLDLSDVDSGDTRFLQVWYRDPSGPCAEGFNVTHSLELVFQP